MEGKKVGEVFTYFAKVGVAGVKITDDSLSVGDKILIKGSTTNLEQIVESMQIDKDPIQKAEVGQSVGLKVTDKVRPGDLVLKI